VEIEGQYHNVYVIKRPGVDQFMKRVGELYEVVVFTASVSKVSPVALLLWLRVRIADSPILSSMGIRSWTSWTSTMSSTTGFLERAATIIKATMSKYA
jgi:hypothetical protein